MSPANDTLYSMHIHQAKRLGKSPLSYADFCARLRGQCDQDLTGLLLPQPDVRASGRVVSKPRFDLGRLCITPNVAAAIPPEELLAALAKHGSGDWGDLCAEDIAQNEHALQCEGRLVSVHVASNGRKFYIITEADRTVTTALLPEDY